MDHNSFSFAEINVSLTRIWKHQRVLHGA